MADTTTVAPQTETHPTATREETRYLSPPVDIMETENELIVVADLPGVEKESLDVRVEDNVLTIQGKVQDVMPGTPISREYRLMNFFRQFALSEEVNQEQISADLKHGVLTLHLPKAEKAKPRQIQVHVS